ncbi:MULTISPECIES: divalent-cation tolerance protein CutA [unclassified Lysobacter]|uniref:divalent-cation tolerance protein CutA n=1 Tax=unclassified Lysobacter TaxID=2635362 RepID=UPI001C24170D|nr:divalent-cation tolerance protein CutA [Lysobacter sp. MMG2]MBU8977685.1 divalent-cation tolerance protein CutA [Lysobacter sp. MMG2]
MTTPSAPPVRLVLSTCPDAQTADALATALVEARLAACVNVLPGVRSTYRWQGAVERGEEVLLLIKTTADREAALVERLNALHPYELPEALAVEAVGGLTAYLDWVAEQTRDDD